MGKSDVDLISLVLGSQEGMRGRRLGWQREEDVEEFVASLPPPFQASSLANLAYLDAGFKHIERSEEEADLVSLMQVGT